MCRHFGPDVKRVVDNSVSNSAAFVLNDLDNKCRRGDMLAKPTSRIIWPGKPLQGCMFCILERDIRGAELSPVQRFNFFPASPLCSITVIVSGGIHLISETGQMQTPEKGERLPDLAFSGPQPGPLVSWATANAFVLTFAFYPDAFAAMSELDLTPYSRITEPIQAVLPGRICRIFQDFRLNLSENIDDLQNVLSEFEHDLAQIWANVRTEEFNQTRWLETWTEDVLAHTAQTEKGKSPRQTARRLKSKTGLSRRELESLSRSEQLYANINAAAKAEKIDWAEIAAEAGFADQAHMIRRMRQHTGFTPARLHDDINLKESLWPYRLLREYFAQPDN